MLVVPQIEELRNRNPEPAFLYESMKRVVRAINSFGKQLNVDPSQDLAAPAAPLSVSVVGDTGTFVVSLADDPNNAQPLSYFAEADADPAFPSPQTLFLGSVRGDLTLAVRIPWPNASRYWRVYSQRFNGQQSPRTTYRDAQGVPNLVSSGGVSDGLIHGDTMWPLDPAWLILRDDFLSPDSATTPTDFGGTGINWTVTNGGTLRGFIGGPLPLAGVVHITNNVAAGSVSFLRQTDSGAGVQSGYPLLDYPGWKLVWTFRISRGNTVSVGAFSWTKVSFYVGLANYVGTQPATTSSPRPPHFMGLRYDTDTTAPAISDTQFVFEYVHNITGTPLTRINTQGTTFATGITVVEGRDYRFEMSCVGDGQVTFRLSDGVSVSATTMAVGKISSANQPTLSTTNGLVLASYTTTFPHVLGSKVTISGGTITAANGDWVEAAVQGAPTALHYFGPTASGVDTGATTTFYPGFLPFLSFGNDTQAGPVAQEKGVMVDFFSLVWNKGLITGGATPNSTLARYW